MGSVHSLITLLRPHYRAVSVCQIVMSNLVAFSMTPDFLAAFLINSKLKHPAAYPVRIVPVAVFAWNLIFHTPGIYPTMPLESEIAPALHFWFGGGFNLDTSVGYMNDVSQYRFAAPAYAGIA